MPSSAPVRRPRKERSKRKFSRSSTSLLAVLEAAPEAVVVIDSQDRIVFCNGVAASLWMVTPDQLDGRAVGDLFGPRFGFICLDAPEGKTFVTEAEAVRADGIPFTVRLSLQRAKIDGKVHRTIWMRLASGYRDEIEARSGQRAQVALERFASGIAHEWNNVLTVVLGNLHLALEDPGTPSRSRTTVLEGAYQATLRGRELARGLLDFATGEAPVIAPQVSAKLAWESALRGLSGTHGKLDADFDPRLWQALIDPAQAGQAIHHVVAFASALAGSSGRMHMTARNWTVASPGQTCGGRLLPGDFVMISLVADQVRLRDDDLQHLFHPYSDVLGCNAGMRLAMARALVFRQDGWLEAERTASGGTVFHFYLPASADYTPEIIPIETGLEKCDALRVLVMDDEQLVRLVLQRTLESMGHQVVAVAEGGEAADAYETAMNRGHRFDLAILDMKVGAGSGGLEACGRILDFDPLATCVLSSGSILDDAMLDSQDYGFAGILEKPFESSALAELIDHLVVGRRRGSLRLQTEQDEDLIQLLHDNILSVDFTNPGRRWE